MKKIMAIGLIALTFNSAFAAGRTESRRLPERLTSDTIQSCLRDLNFSRSELRLCRMNQIDPRIVEDYRRENEQLRRQVDEMSRERELERERREQERQKPTLGFFSYSGCKNSAGNIDLTQIKSAEGLIALESETLSKQNTAKTLGCYYGVILGKTEEIRISAQVSYCVAGCKNSAGNVDQSQIMSAKGRNQTEAEYKALVAAQGTYGCYYGVKVSACQ